MLNNLLNHPVLILRFLNGPVFFLAMCILMFIFLEIGRRVRLSILDKKQVTTSLINGPVETVIFALLGLLVAFTFTGAGTRFETRRQLIGTEAGAIRIVYLRIDMLPKQVQPQMHNLLKRYTLARAFVYKNVANESTTKSALNFAESLQKQMWDVAVANCNKKGALNECSRLVFPALNNMFDITTTREAARESHPPLTIYLLLILLSLFSAVLVGYDLPHSGKRNMLYMISYALIISLILYLVVEIEMPRHGLITINEADHIIFDLVGKM